MWGKNLVNVKRTQKISIQFFFSISIDIARTWTIYFAWLGWQNLPNFAYIKNLRSKKKIHLHDGTANYKGILVHREKIVTNLRDLKLGKIACLHGSSAVP